MPGKVIPFPAADNTGRSEVPIIARHHIERQLGRNRYDVDVIGFIKALPALSASPKQGNVPVPFHTNSSAPGGLVTPVQVVGWSRWLRHGRVVIAETGREQAAMGAILAALGHRHTFATGNRNGKDFAGNGVAAEG